MDRTELTPFVVPMLRSPPKYFSSIWYTRRRRDRQMYDEDLRRGGELRDVVEIPARVVRRFLPMR